MKRNETQRPQHNASTQRAGWNVNICSGISFGLRSGGCRTFESDSSQVSPPRSLPSILPPSHPSLLHAPCLALEYVPRDTPRPRVPASPTNESKSRQDEKSNPLPPQSILPPSEPFAKVSISSLLPFDRSSFLSLPALIQFPLSSLAMLCHWCKNRGCFSVCPCIFPLSRSLLCVYLYTLCLSPLLSLPYFIPLVHFQTETLRSLTSFFSLFYMKV